MSQRVVITGGGSGIGRTLARRFRAHGDRIALCDADPAAIAETQAEFPDAICATADVRNETQMDRFFAQVEIEWGGADVVCANAGTGGPAGLIEDTDYEAWQACVGVNLFGAYLTCRWAARVMKPQNAGVILLTSSTAGQFGYPYRSAYCSAKWALTGLTKTLAMELGPHNIRVNAICPGAVEGDRMERVIAMESEASGLPPEDIRKQHVGGISLRTWVSEDDLADTMLFLASPGASKISGQILAIDGHTETLVP